MTSAESLAWDNGAGGLPYGGELILALDPQRFLGAQAQEQLARAETLFNAMQDQGARLPGERRFACRQQSEQQGVTISRSLARRADHQSDRRMAQRDSGGRPCRVSCSLFAASPAGRVSSSSMVNPRRV